MCVNIMNISNIKTYVSYVSTPLLLLGGVVIFFSSIIIGDKRFTSDGQLAAYYQHFALWSGDWATGWPIIGDPVSMPLYPVRLAIVALNMPFDIFVITAYVLAIFGMYFFLRVFLDKGPAAFGAISFTISGWMLVHLGHTSMIHAAAWLPWMMLGISFIVLDSGAKKYRGLTLLSVAVSMSVLAGHTQITVYSLLLVAAYAIYMVSTNKDWSAIYFIALGVFCGVVISLPVLIPTAELTTFTYRNGISIEELFSYSLPLAEMPGLIIPLLYGSTPFGWFGHDYQNPGYRGETITFFPAIGLFFAIIAFVSVREERGHIIFWLLVGLLSLLFALGSAFFPIAFLTEHLFPLNMFRAPSRHMLEVTFCFSVLSAIGLQALLDKYVQVIQIRVAIFIYMLLFVLAISSVLAVRDLLGLDLAQLIWPTLFALLMIILSFALIVIRDHSGRFVVFEYISIAILLMHTVMIGYQLPWRIYAPSESHNTQPEWISDFKGKLGYDYRALGMNGWQSQVFNPDISRLHGIRILGWYGPMLNKNIAELSGLTSGGWIQRFVLSDKDVTLDLLSVRYVSIPGEEKQLMLANPDRWRLVKSYGNEYVFENLKVLPRARLVCQASKIESDNVFNLSVRDGRSTLSVVDHAYVNDALPSQLPSHIECLGHVNILRDDGDSVRIKANVDSDRAILVLSDLWYPGWQVYVNGNQSPVYRVNNTSKGVLLPNGPSDVKFVYRPTNWNLSILITIMSLGLVAILLFVRSGLLIFSRFGRCLYRATRSIYSYEHNGF